MLFTMLTTYTHGHNVELFDIRRLHYRSGSSRHHHKLCHTTRARNAAQMVATLNMRPRQRWSYQFRGMKSTIPYSKTMSNTKMSESPSTMIQTMSHTASSRWWHFQIFWVCAHLYVVHEVIHRWVLGADRRVGQPNNSKNQQRWNKAGLTHTRGVGKGHVDHDLWPTLGMRAYTIVQVQIEQTSSPSSTLPPRNHRAKALGMLSAKVTCHDETWVRRTRTRSCVLVKAKRIHGPF